MISRVRDLVTGQPVLISSAIRVTVLCATAFGLSWTADQIAAAMLVVEAWLAVASFLLSTPTAKVDGIETTAVETGRAQMLAEFVALDAAGAEQPEQTPEAPRYAEGGVIPRPSPSRPSGPLRPRPGPR